MAQSLSSNDPYVVLNLNVYVIASKECKVTSWASRLMSTMQCNVSSLAVLPNIVTFRPSICTVRW